jgi:hypothetical protein
MKQKIIFFQSLPFGARHRAASDTVSLWQNWPVAMDQCFTPMNLQRRRLTSVRAGDERLLDQASGNEPPSAFAYQRRVNSPSLNTQR